MALFLGLALRLTARQGGGSAPPAPATDAILMESGDFLLLESGDKILLEA